MLNCGSGLHRVSSSLKSTPFVSLFLHCVFLHYRMRLAWPRASSQFDQVLFEGILASVGFSNVYAAVSVLIVYVQFGNVFSVQKC